MHYTTIQVKGLDIALYQAQNFKYFSLWFHNCFVNSPFISQLHEVITWSSSSSLKGVLLAAFPSLCASSQTASLGFEVMGQVT